MTGVDFTSDAALPVATNLYTVTTDNGGARATSVSTYELAEALQQVRDMGVVEGASSAVNQIDGLLA